MLIMEAELNQTFQTHASSLQKGFYIRPFYEQDRGWSLAVVDLKTGKRADVLLSPHNDPLACAAANLPVFAVDATGSLILSKGLGLDPDFETYENLAPGGAHRPSKWTVPFPSVLALDIKSFRFKEGPGKRTPAVKPVAPEKKKLNDGLRNAAFQSDLEKVKNALDAGADINAVDEYGQTALMLAAESLRVYNKKDIVALLLDRGADITIKDPEGWTAVEHFFIVSYDAMTTGVSDGVVLLLKAQEKASQKGNAGKE